MAVGFIFIVCMDQGKWFLIKPVEKTFIMLNRRLFSDVVCFHHVHARLLWTHLRKQRSQTIDQTVTTGF